ncbi:MAG: UDP-N-acetylglucosamine--N-acetylmuramyl-(pentapeptide) pyrophosphoryl-undecaprenol N-acetylglucosamine transferase [Bacilli bacterium]
MRVIFSAGGTGGHLYPALYLAKYMQSQNPDLQVLFVGSKYRLEASEVIKYGFDFIGLDVKTPSGHIFNKVKGYLDVFLNIKTCKKIINEFKPDIVIGFGGYTSYSIMEAANQLKIPIVIHEQNSYLGKSNQVLAKKAKAIITCFDLSSQITHNVYQLGNPVVYKTALSQLVDLKSLGLNPNYQTVLIVMGSQGSQTIDLVIRSLLKKLALHQTNLIYVCGHDYYQGNDQSLLQDNILILPYSDNLGGLIKSSTLIISRAGASSLAEISFAKKPALLIPSIYVTNNHQYHNAKLYEQAGSAIIINEDQDLEQHLLNNITTLINDEPRLHEMAQASSKVNYPKALEKIYELIVRIVGETSE